MSNNTEWTIGKHALITGASDGIGKEIARNLANKCRKITGVAILPEKLKALEEELKGSKAEIETYSIDICDKKKMGELIQQVYEKDNDQIDIFINCAGGSHVIEPFEKINYSDIEKIFDTNAKAPIFMLKEILPRMKKNKMDKNSLKRGHIVMMSSRSAERALPNLIVYAAAKGAVEKLVEGLQREFAQYRLVFTLVAPGSINTSFTSKWPQKPRDEHNAESISVKEAVIPILHALDAEYATNRISYESTTQWLTELGVTKSSK
jgi:short-subunit dehydrogenase